MAPGWVGSATSVVPPRESYNVVPTGVGVGLEDAFLLHAGNTSVAIAIIAITGRNVSFFMLVLLKYVIYKFVNLVIKRRSGYRAAAGQLVLAWHKSPGRIGQLHFEPVNNVIARSLSWEKCKYSYA